MSVECWDGLITWHKVILTFEINSEVNYFVSTNAVDQTYITVKGLDILQPK